MLSKRRPRERRTSRLDREKDMISLAMVEVMAPEGPWVFHRLSTQYDCRESKKSAEERGRSAEEAGDRLSRSHAVDLPSINQLDELRR